MVFDFIKHWLFDKAYNAQIEYDKGSSRFVGVFMLYNGQSSELDQVIQILAHQGVKYEDIKFLLFQNSKGELPTDKPIYGLNQIHWSGYPNSTKIDEFLKNNFKNFYYLIPELNSQLKFIVHKVKSEFSAGIYSKGIEPYMELTIDNQYISPPNSLKEIFQLITKLKSK